MALSELDRLNIRKMYLNDLRSILDKGMGYTVELQNIDRLNLETAEMIAEVMEAAETDSKIKPEF
jgi:hypothetical protein